MLNVNNRRGMQYANKRMDELRKIAVKTELEQKEFIDLKYPVNRGKRAKWTFKRIIMLIIMIIFYAGVFIIWLKIFAYYNINFKIWQAVIIIFLGPTLINILLKRIGLQRNDISVFFK
jgi:hypothetical protein